MPVKKFDGESGQVYLEHICKIRRPVDRWAYATRGSTEGLHHYVHSRGAASLEAMSLRTILVKSAELTTKEVRGLPAQYAEQIWKELKSSQLLSLSVWAAFVSAYPEERLYRYYRSRVQMLDSPLYSYLDQISTLTSNNESRLTFLTLHQNDYMMKDLISISNLPNLASLRLCQDRRSPSNLDDRMIWKWTQRIVNSGATTSLQYLRSIELSGYPGVTMRSVEYLSLLPALTQIKLLSHQMDAPYGWHCQGRTSSDLNDQIRERVEHELRGEWDTLHPRVDLSEMLDLDQVASITDYTRACHLVDGVRVLDRASSQPILFLNIGPAWNTDSSWQDDGRAIVVWRNLLDADASSNDLQSNAGSDPHQSSQGFLGNKHPREEQCAHEAKKRMLKSGKRSNLDEVIHGFMF